MRKFLLFVFTFCISISLQAQQKKKGGNQKKATSTTTKKTASTGSKLSRDDANKIIVYNNSIRQFIGGSDEYLRIHDFGTFYDLAIEQLGKSNPGQPSSGYDPVSDRTADFDNAYKRFVADLPRSKDSYTDVFLPPAQIKAENVTFFKTKLEELKSVNQACYEQYKNCSKYFGDNLTIKKSTNKKEIVDNLKLLEPLLVKLYSLEDEIFNKVSEMGDVAEEVTLASHPMKKEIFDFRKCLRINSQIQKIIQNENPEELIANVQKLDSLNNLLKPISVGYTNYDVYKAGPGSENMKFAIYGFFTAEGLGALIEATSEVKDKHNNPKELKKIREKAHRAEQVMQSNYSRFVTANNSGQ